MKMKKILKVVAILICILIILFLVHTIRNYIIITDLQEKVSEYYDCTNYHTKHTAKQDNGTIMTFNYYKKDGKQVYLIEKNINEKIQKIAVYCDGETRNAYIENNGEKIALLNSKIVMYVSIFNSLETENNIQTLVGSIFANIKSTNYNGKECYIIKNFQSYLSLGVEGEEVYIDKDTGLYVKKTGNGENIEKEYEFNNVDDSIFIEPDISQYKIKENI